MRRTAFAALAMLLAGPALGAEVDYTEVWHACDDAALDQGFAEAGLPEGTIGGSTLLQLGGQWEGQTLHVITVPTTTGTVFCMATEDLRVVQYKFEGRQIILRD